MNIYISGLYSNGDVAQNIHNAIKAADKLVEQGDIPYIPHLTHFWHLVSPKPYEFWMDYDLDLLPLFDAIYMLKGWRDSKGAVLERTTAEELGMQIIYEEDEL